MAEEELETLIRDQAVEAVWFSYSDVSHGYVMHRAAQVNAWGAHFCAARRPATMVESTKPVIAVTAVRTGVGKSQTTRYVSRILKSHGQDASSPSATRCPTATSRKQVCQRFATYEDLDRHQCTIEEREEYEPHIDNGFVVYAGVDYEKILREAEKEADVILWDGGNNDTPFYRPDLQITLVDPHRPGHEVAYYPGETNLLMADVIIVNKVDTADPEKVAAVEATCRRINPKRA